MRSSFDFSDAQVLVTGGSNGIGLAVARAFRDAGARVKGDAGHGTSNVNIWLDQSGHGNDAVQTAAARRPAAVAAALNGRPAVRFDAVDEFFSRRDRGDMERAAAESARRYSWQEYGAIMKRLLSATP